MCGISGYLDLSAGVRPEILHKMNDVITYRGPDDEGYALIGREGIKCYGGSDSMPELVLPSIDETDGQRAFLGLGHRRLSIVDLSVNGHQPMILPERDIAVVYNGEIYNFIELREELSNLGYTFHTSCDTEILLYAYCEWGEECLSHFNGMWGFAIWDGREKKLFCARDRLGAKPFHYWRKGNKMLFGSELKQLCQDETIPRYFDKEYLADNLIFTNSDYNDHTLIEDFKVLSAGHKLVVRLSPDCQAIESFQIERYWDLNTDYREDLSIDEWKSMVADSFARSCRWRLRSDAPIAVLLSGGLDSSCLVTEMCEQLKSPHTLETFTTSYPDRVDCDEWKYANMVNKACGCRGNQFLADPKENIEQLYEDCVWHAEGLNGSTGLSALGPRLLFKEIRKRGYKVILNGQCGDETMFGYDWYYAFFLADLLRQGRVGELVSVYKQITRHSNVSAPKLFAGFCYYNSSFVRTTRKLHIARSFVQEETLRSRDPEHANKYLTARSLKDIQLKGLTCGSLSTIVRHDDRMYMSESLESRLPFMDYQFVELAAQIPPEFKIHNGYTKSIMREVFDNRMPKEVTWRTDKMGFLSPLDRFAGYFDQGYLVDITKNARTAPYFKMGALRHLAETNPTSQQLFQFLQIELFARLFDVR